MSIENELLVFLENQNYSLDYRVKTIINTLFSLGLSTLNSRKIILLWLERTLQTDLNETDLMLLYSLLNHCIVNFVDTLHNFELIDIVVQILSNSTHLFEEAYECFAQLLKNVHFVPYFIHNTKKLTTIINNLSNKLTILDVELKNKTEICLNIVNCILNMKDNALYDNNVKLNFVKYLLEPLSTVINIIESEEIIDLQYLENCVFQVLFRDSSFKIFFSSNILNECPQTDSDNKFWQIINIIKMYPSKFSSETLASSYYLLLSGFCLSNSSFNEKLNTFIALNSLVNICPISFDHKSQNVCSKTSSLLTANALIKVLLRFDVPSNVTCGNFSFTLLDWLSNFVDVILEKINSDLNIVTLELLTNIFNCCPQLIENYIKKFIHYVMLIKKPERLLQSYCNLCINILNVHIKLNRMHKLISVLLTTIRENLCYVLDQDLPDKFCILPKEMFDKIEKAVTNLPSTVQSVALLNTLLFHFENDCVKFLENDSNEADEKFLLLFDTVTYLIIRFMLGSRVADNSVPDVVKNKYVLLMSHLSELLGRCGKALVAKEHISKLTNSFLNLCLIWGDTQLLFIMYEIHPRTVPKQVGKLAETPTNLVYLHPYLSDYYWNLIAQRVVNFGDESCNDSLDNLILQKINALPHLEDEIEGPYIENVNDDGPAVVCAHYLSTQANAKWLSTHIAGFVHLLKPKDILLISKILINHFKQCDENEISRIFTEDMHEIRTLCLGMCFYAFHSISKKLSKSYSKHLKRILRRLDYEEILNVEAEYDQHTTRKHQEIINEIGILVSNDIASSTEVVEDIKNDVQILVHLPARYLHDESKSIVCLLSLSLVKSLIAFGFQSRENEPILNNMLQFLAGLLSDVNLPGSLNIGKLIALLYFQLKNVMYCDNVLKKLCKISIKHKSSVNCLIDVVNSENTCENISDVSKGLELVACYIINLQRIRKKKVFLDEETEEKIMHICLENFQKAMLACSDNVVHREKLLILYMFMLRKYWQSQHLDKKDTLLTYLNQFIKFIENDLQEYSSNTVNQFFFLLLKNRSKWDECLFSFIYGIWHSYWYLLEDPVNRLFLEVISMQEYEETLQILYTYTECSLDEINDENMSSLLRIWETVIKTTVKNDKSEIKKNIIFVLCLQARKFVILRNHKHLSVMKMFLTVLNRVIQNKKIAVSYQVIDICFELISFAIGQSKCSEILTLSIELLFCFCTVRTVHLVDRIASFYLCYKSLFEKLIEMSKTNDSSDEELIITAAHKLEKLTDSLIKHKRDLIKTSLSAVADLLQLFVNITSENELKMHLKNTIFCWIDICDSYGHHYLSSTLSPVLQNVFKQLNAEYEKYHKFTGKV